MNLSEIRDLFIKRCGRYDLITEDGQDAGANFFIQSGSRFLDRRADLDEAACAVVPCQALKDGIVRVERCWSVEEVYALDYGYRKLKKLASRRDPRFIMSRQREPLYYTTISKRYSPRLDKMPAFFQQAPASSFNYSQVWPTHLVIEILPHPVVAATIEVHGRFYSEPLVDDSDTNTWSDLYPDTLVKAALYELEVFYRNTEGANDWLNAIQLDLTDAEQLEVRASVHGKDIMGL